MTETTARIRWEPAEHGGFTGHVGNINPPLFTLRRRRVAWVLTAAIPGTSYRIIRDDAAHPLPPVTELKGQAERWLEEFTSSLGAVFPEAHDLPPVGPDGMRELTCDACGGVFGTNFSEEQIECAHCDARRCPHCGEWFGRDD